MDGASVQCPGCQNELEKVCKFCSECGCKLDVSLWQQKPSTYECSCGTECDLKRKFCSDCGVKNPHTEDLQAHISKDTDQKSKGCGDVGVAASCQIDISTDTTRLNTSGRDNSQDTVDKSDCINAGQNQSENQGIPKDHFQQSQQPLNQSENTKSSPDDEVNGGQNKFLEANICEQKNESAFVQSSYTGHSGEGLDGDCTRSNTDSAIQDAKFEIKKTETDENMDCIKVDKPSDVKGENGNKIKSLGYNIDDQKNMSAIVQPSSISGEALDDDTSQMKKSKIDENIDCLKAAETTDNVKEPHTDSTNEKTEGKSKRNKLKKSKDNKNEKNQSKGSSLQNQTSDNHEDPNKSLKEETTEEDKEKEEMSIGHDFTKIEMKETGEIEVTEPNPSDSQGDVSMPGFRIRYVDNIVSVSMKHNSATFKDEKLSEEQKSNENDSHAQQSSFDTVHPSPDEPFRSVFGADVAEAATVSGEQTNKVFGSVGKDEKSYTHSDKHSETEDQAFKIQIAEWTSWKKQSSTKSSGSGPNKKNTGEIVVLCTIRDIVDNSLVSVILPASKCCKDLFEEVGNKFSYKLGSFQLFYAKPKLKKGSGYDEVDMEKYKDSALSSVLLHRGDQKGNAFFMYGKDNKRPVKLQKVLSADSVVKCVVRNLVPETVTEIHNIIPAAVTCQQLLVNVADHFGYEPGTFTMCYLKGLSNQSSTIDLEKCSDKALFDICQHVGNDEENVFTIDYKEGVDLIGYQEASVVCMIIDEIKKETTSQILTTVPASANSNELLHHVEKNFGYKIGTFSFYYVRPTSDNQSILVDMESYLDKSLLEVCSHVHNKKRNLFTVNVKENVQLVKLKIDSHKEILVFCTIKDLTSREMKELKIQMPASHLCEQLLQEVGHHFGYKIGTFAFSYLNLDKTEPVMLDLATSLQNPLSDICNDVGNDQENIFYVTDGYAPKKISSSGTIILKKESDKGTKEDVTKKKILSKNNLEQFFNASSNDPLSGNYTVRNKKLTEEESYYEGNKSKKDKGKKKDGKQEGKVEMVIVHFHVVVSPDFKYNSNKHSIQLKFTHADLQATSGFGHPLHEVLDRGDDKYRVMKCAIPIPRNLLNHHLYYKYSLVKSDKILGEFLYHRYVHQYTLDNRSFVIPHQHMTGLETWHQYDCMMHPHPDEEKRSLFQNIRSFVTGDDYKHVIKHNKMAAFLLMPRWAGFTPKEKPTCQTAEETLNEISRMYNSMKEMFFEPGGNRQDRTLFREVLMDYIDPAVKRLEYEQKMGHKEHKESNKEAILRISTAITIICLSVTYELSKQDHSLNKAIFHALLLTTDNNNKKCVVYDELLKIEFPSKKEEILLQLKRYVQYMARDDYILDTWIFAVPLIHFMEGTSSPFEKLYLTTKHNTEEWWGVTGIKEVKQVYMRKKERNKDVPVKMYIEYLSPLFELDQMLPRTLIATIPLEESILEMFKTGKFAPEICVANLYYFLLAEKGFCTNLENLKSVTSRICVALAEDVKVERNTQELMHVWLVETEVMCFFVIDLLKSATSRFLYSYKHEFVQCVVRVFIAGINGLLCALKQANHLHLQKDMLDNLYNVGTKCLEEGISRMKDWCHVVLPKPEHVVRCYRDTTMSDAHELKIFSWLMMAEIEDEPLRELWNQEFLSLLETRLNWLTSKQRLELLCYLEPDICHQRIDNMLTSMAFDALQKQGKSGEYHFMFELAGSSREASREATRLGELLTHLFETAWPKEKGHPCRDPYKVLNHMLKWRIFPKFLALFRGKGGNPDLLGEHVQTEMAIAIEEYDRMERNLITGNIMIKDLELIIENITQFAEVSSVLKIENNQTPLAPSKEEKDKVLAKVKHWRKKELRKFFEIREMVENLMVVCTGFEVDVDHLKSQLKVKVYDLKLPQVCDPLQYSKPNSSLVNYEPRITFFDVSEELLLVLKDLKDLSASLLFFDEWKYNFHQAYNNKKDLIEGNVVLTLEELQESVWEPTSEAISQMMADLHEGTMPLSVVKQKFNNYKDRYSELYKELVTLCPRDQNPSWIGDCVDKIEKFYKINMYKVGADKMQAVVRSLQLKGNFQVLDTLLSTDEESDVKMTLSDISASVVTAGQDLMDVTEEKASCIGVLSECKPLVNWLRDLKQGTKEIKVLVDLAMMSAQGQSDIEVEKVQCLSDAAMGYAPLIYELDLKADFKEFLKQCQQVWKSFEANKDLPERLRELARNLEWLENIKKSHGSTELNSLAQAQNINTRGIFKVGFIEELAANDYNKNLDTVVQLMLQPAKKKSEKKPPGIDEDQPKLIKYSLQQLNDLQSRLMLVAGKAVKGKEDVDRFVEILDGVTRLGKVYIKLCSAGSIIFKRWTVIFYCDANKKVHTEVDFGLSKKIMKGSSDMQLNVTSQIVELCEFLEKCLDKWTTEIDEKRKDYYYLNHFTTEQLVILRKELAKVCNGQCGDKVIYPMLGSVKKDCTPMNLSEAIREAFAQCEKDEMNPKEREGEISDEEIEVGAESDEEKESSNEPVEDLQAKREKAAELMKELVNTGYSERLAYEALQNVDIDDEDCLQDAIFWCVENEDEEFEDLDNHDMLSFENNQEYPGLSLNEGSGVDLPHHSLMDYSSLIQSITLDDMTTSLLDSIMEPKNSLKEQLENLWQTYVEKSGTTSVSDFFSVEHLGMVLQELAKQDDKVIKRPFPETFTTGKPNLVICPQAEVLQTLLSVYMCQHGQDLPLPTATEVLMCTHLTRAEEVDLLMRRCFDGQYNPGHVYCLVNADRLDYEVSTKVEASFDNLSREKSVDKEYRLVIICSRERAEKSSIATAFDKYSVKNLWMFAIEEIQDYLHRHFRVETEEAVEPAASLDPHSLSVRVVQSKRAGVGKTLKAKRLAAQMKRQYPKEGRDVYVNISLHRRHVDNSAVLKDLLWYTESPGRPIPKLFHLDIAHEVLYGVDDLLFNLLVLGSLTDQQGHVWLRSEYDLYVIEILPLLEQEVKAKHQVKSDKHGPRFLHPIFHLLPKLTCWSPKDSLDILGKTQGVEGEIKLTDYPDFRRHDQLMDIEEFESESWQRVYQYLKRFHEGKTMDTVDPSTPEGTQINCLEILLRFCGIKNPSWAELRHFVWFLSIQLKDSEESSFCSVHAAEDLPGMKTFVVKSMIQMSRDFATRSLNISEETPGLMDYVDEDEFEDEGEDDPGIERFQMKRTWETSPHPYIFFNSDHHSLTFLGFNIERRTGNMIDLQTGQILEQRVMQRQLQEGLHRNGVPLQEDFDALPRVMKIIKLCNVMGNSDPHDPDETYVLTTDNSKKIMAIFMRFRCRIPVIIMGETGCGKTRLVKFMCDLQKPQALDIDNMILMKVHGGTTERDIRNKLSEATKLTNAIQLAAASKYDQAIKLAGTIKLKAAEKLLAALDMVKNDPEYLHYQKFPNINVVLFFDEANTTEEIGLIKQVMCDHIAQMETNVQDHGLKIVAACNPYRKHSDDMIKRLEHAGLGYHIKADQTTDKLGRIPMRRLVYRVQALPQSMLPLVWDFGQLNTDTEQKYIEQMVRKFVNDDKLPNAVNLQETVSKILAESQDFMRRQQDECSFVSLRDVERALNVMAWFYKHRQQLFGLMDQRAEKDMAETQRISVDEVDYEPPDEITRCLILALGVCYHACLQKRKEYREHVAQFFRAPLQLSEGPDTLDEEINRCQNVFLDQVELDANIARNQALKENVFMMIVCIELRIPLFLVGKPGSSKSLAKTIVADAMQGETAKSDLFKTLKFVHMVSFQCSPLATPDGIVGTFKQCATLQQRKDVKKYVSVVVLDEVGLAEDSPRMPLKTLHPLLEDGCEGDEEPEEYKKVAFIGISNWALDPAKMNRGILVQRGVPDETELVHSARGICATDRIIQNHITSFMEPIAKFYLDIYKQALKQEDREYFGLRDFYSIIKMVYGFSNRSKKPPTWYELKHSILRNFGGLESVNPEEIFLQYKPHSVDNHAEPRPGDPDCTAAGLIQACLFGKGLKGIDIQSRYLLILTENYAALKILQQKLLEVKNAITIFGSSFPKDQEYTQVCRNINRIKICMETGQTVVLLNLENLYESLYDALNQYYVYFGGQQFVDLGLGTHRVKCRVHKRFRLIVVAEKQVVYKTFPIPLINRLEKHTLTMETMLSDQQLQWTLQLENWAKLFAEVEVPGIMDYTGKKQTCSVGDVFIGYDKDTPASIVLQISEHVKQQMSEDTTIEHSDADSEDEEEGLSRQSEQQLQMERQVIEKCKEMLLQCATPESIIRLCHSHLKGEEKHLSHIYDNVQKHDSLVHFLQHYLKQYCDKDFFAQITTHSKLLSAMDKLQISRLTNFPARNIWLKSLQAFDTEQQFCKLLKDFFTNPLQQNMLLILQCDSGNENAAMIASARYNLLEEHKDLIHRRHVVFAIQLPRVAGGCFVGFQGGKWLCYHIDDLHPEEGNLPGLSVLRDQSIGTLFTKAITNDNKENDDLAAEFETLNLSSNQRSRHGLEILKQKSRYTAGARSMRGISEDSGMQDDQDLTLASIMEKEIDEHDDMTGERSENTGDDIQGTDHNIADITDVSLDFTSPRGPVESTPIGDGVRTRVPEFGRKSQDLFGVPGINGEPGRLLESFTTEADRRELDVDAILQNCIHSAAAMLEDNHKSSHRKTERVTLLMKLMEKKQEGDGIQFLDVIKKRVALLLNDKENKHTNRLTVSNWLPNVAASREAVAKAGTLRRSVWHHIESKVTPMLAGVLGYIDADDNLNHMNEAQEEWIQEYWLEMLNSSSVTRLTYKDLQSATQRAELDKIQVARHGCQGSNFANSLPFSWIIKETMDLLIFQAKKRGRDSADESIMAEVDKYLLESPLGRVINKVFKSPTDYDTMVDRYLNDFIKMSYKPVTQQQESVEKELSLIKKAILSAAKQSHLLSQQPPQDPEHDEPPLEDQDFKLTLPVIHMIFMSLQSRLQLVIQTFSLWPEAVNQIWAFRSRQHVFNTDAEFTLDVHLLTLILEHIQPILDDKHKGPEEQEGSQEKKPKVDKKQKTEPKKGKVDELDGSPEKRQGWVRKIERFQPLIERMLGYMGQAQGVPWMLALGERCLQQLEECKCMYSRVCAVQLLIEHVCVATETNLDLGFRKCKPLWQLLAKANVVNFKTLKSIESVEKYLKSTNISAYKHYFETVKKCPHCTDLMEDPITLPCKHIICNSCVQLRLEMGERNCPECKEPYPAKFKPIPGKDQKKEALAGYRAYKKQCNSFFMALVSHLCFHGDSPPQEAVIHKLLGYITRKSLIEDGEVIVSTQMAPLKDRDAIDPTPVVRSFLLQLLLRSHMSKVQSHIDEYFTMARQLLGDKDLNHTVQLALLIAHCLEDSHHKNYQRQPNIKESLNFVRELLRQSHHCLTDDGLTIVKLEAVAGTRFGLQLVADWLFKVYIEEDNLAGFVAKQMIEAAQVLCSRDDINWPRLYLIRQLNQRYGIASLQTLSDKVPWLMSQEATDEQDTDHPDRFIITGENYQAIREAIAQFLATKDSNALETTLKAVKQKGILKHRDILLALYTEVTGCNKFEEDDKKIHPEIIAELEKFINESRLVTQKDLANSLIRNNLGNHCEMLKVVPKQDWLPAMMAEMVVHFIAEINTMEMSTLMQPFRMIATKPERMQDLFLPTMPQEDLKYVNEAMQKYLQESHRNYEKIEIYKCPNGHAYAIGDCGRPYYKANCNVCGKPIGGQSHNLEQDNTKVETIEEQPGTGHILGVPENRQKVAIPERKMSPASTAIIRLFTHISMYVGANVDPEAVAAMIVPTIPVQQVPNFLWGHMIRDIDVLAAALGKSPDDCVLLMHIIMDGIIRNGNQYKKIDATLKTKESREKWETKFVTEYVTPMLKDINNRLQNANNDLINDKRLGNKPLLRMIYEASDEPVVDMEHIEEMSPMWKLRSRVTLEHLTQDVNEYSLTQKTQGEATAIKVLKLFLQYEHKLRALQYLPRIMRLQQLLVQRYNGAIDLAEATNMTVTQFLMSLPQGVEDEDHRLLIEDFGKAWELIKQHLPTFGFVGNSVHRDFCDTRITMGTNMAMLLPSWKGQGLCSIATVYFLCAAQSEFLDKYAELAVQNTSEEISSDNATPADLVAYDPDRELLPLVIANCNYSVSVNEGINQKYDLEALARQVQERFIRGRSKVEPKVQEVVFRKDFTNAQVFAALNEKIEQEPMSPTLHQQIMTECRHVKEITDSLARLDITISFLVSLGEDNEAMLGEYMNKTLNMKKALHSEKAMQQCCMKHVRSLWLLLSHERAKMLAKYAQDPFDNVSQDYREALSQEQIAGLHNALHQTNVDVFLRELYECILLQITVKTKSTGEEVVDNKDNPLGYTLDAYIDAVSGPEIVILTDPEKFPADLLVKHAVSTWLEAYTYARNTSHR